jgi:hypothetical protein
MTGFGHAGSGFVHGAAKSGNASIDLVHAAFRLDDGAFKLGDEASGLVHAAIVSVDAAVALAGIRIDAVHAAFEFGGDGLKPAFFRKFSEGWTRFCHPFSAKLGR